MEDFFDSEYRDGGGTCLAAPAGGGGGGGAYAAAAPAAVVGAYSSDEIELALQEAENLLGGGPVSPQRLHREPFFHASPVRACVPAPRTASAASLGEAAINLRLTLHEKELELLELRAQCAQLAVSAHAAEGLPSFNAAL